HTTYGLFVEITEQMAGEIGMKVDRAGFAERMKEHEELSRSGPKRRQSTVPQQPPPAAFAPHERKRRGPLPTLGDSVPKTDDTPKYEGTWAKAKYLAWVKDDPVLHTDRLEVDDEVALLLDRTNFYAEQGGQVGDTGT